jgi:diguanylate cyclase (GGDEF)-like protein/PAS domain S-box-containing protein
MTHSTNHFQTTILIVDDLPDNLRVLQAAISDYGFKVRCAKSGSMALTAAQADLPALVLLDINMPDMDGYEVCRSLKANEKTREVPVIFLSAIDDAFDKVKAFEVGGADYITKPFQVEEVLIRIQNQLELLVAKREIIYLNADLEKRVKERTTLLNEEIEERKQIEVKLQGSEKRLESILNSLEEVVWSIALPPILPLPSTTFTPKLLYINRSAEKVFGRSIAEFFKDSQLWLEATHPEDRQEVEQAVPHLLDTGSISLNYRIVRPDGEIRWISDRRQIIYDDLGNASRIDGVISDITNQKLAEERLRHDALHDSLTGLPNRTLFMERVEQALKRSKRHPENWFAVLFIDLDRFKLINDSFGHGVGDELLIEVAALIEGLLRSTDTVARLGGDEFTILLDDLQDKADVELLTDRILKKLTSPLSLGEYTIFMSASIGVVLSSKGYQKGEDLLRDADIAMYRAKSKGKGCYSIFDVEMYEQTLNLLQMHTDLQLASERQEFLLHYQPIVSLQTGQIMGLEALIRWQHPVRGLISPADFIPAAEETGLIIQIGEWVLQEACQQMQIWQTQFPEISSLKMSINLASKQFQEQHFIETLDRILSSTGVEASSLELEITESVLMDQGEATLHLLSQLKSRRISLSIDDFGTGYSSLGYLRRFPINRLKVDRSFVSHMNIVGENCEIVRTIINLAHTLGMDVVAEGVETVEQRDLLQLLGCEFAQGYLFYKPLNAQEAMIELSKIYAVVG